MNLFVNIVAVLAVLSGELIGDSNLKGPADPLASDVVTVLPKEIPMSPGTIMTRGLFYLYQDVFGPAQGSSRCPMSPSCSEYGKLAVRDHGLFKGLLITGDRLHRCGHDLSYYPRMSTRDKQIHEDPPPSR